MRATKISARKTSKFRPVQAEITLKNLSQITQRPIGSYHDRKCCLNMADLNTRVNRASRTLIPAKINGQIDLKERTNRVKVSLNNFNQPIALTSFPFHVTSQFVNYELSSV